MKKKETSLTEVLESGYDCAWVITGEGDFQNEVTVLLDWKLRGQLTRVLEKKSRKITVIPSMGSIPIPFVVLDPSGEPDWTQIREKCEGVNWKNLLVVLEEDIKTAAPKSYFERIVISSP